MAISTFLGKGKEEKKHLGYTPLMKWNSLTPKLFIFVVGIVVNDEFLSLH